MGIVKTKPRVASYCFRPSATVLNNNENPLVPVGVSGGVAGRLVLSCLVGSAFVGPKTVG